MCVPTSAAMVLEYFGDTVSPMAVKSMCPSHEDFAGTYYVDLVVGLEKLGYHWQIERFRANHAGFESGLHTIAAAIEAGNPVLASTFSPPIGHTMVVVGYSDSAKTLKLLDPNRQLGSAKGVSFREFEKIWRDNLEPDHRYIILTHPRSFHRN
jgi:hypothetical protein